MVNPKEAKYRVQIDQQWLELQQKLKVLPLEEQTDIHVAYNAAFKAHRKYFRKSGEPYITHPLAVASILFDAGVRNGRMFVAALLHDVPEETTHFEDAAGPVSFGDDGNWDRIKGSFDRETAFMVTALTPPKKWVFGEHADEEYYNAMRHSTPEAIIVKMADRLHNLRTLDAMPLEKQIAKIKETEEIYYPIFARAVEAYPKEGGLLLSWIKEAVAERKSGLRIGV